MFLMPKIKITNTHAVNFQHFNEVRVMQRIWLLVLILVIISPSVEAATTVTVKGNVINITAIDGTDWDYITDFPGATNGLYIWSIAFYPSIQADKCTFRLGSATGNIIFHANSDNAYDESPMYFPPDIPFKLYLDSDDPGDTAVIVIILR